MNRKIAIDTGKSTTKIVAENKGNTSRHLSFITAIKPNTDYTEDKTNHILEYEGKTYLVGSQAKSYMEIDNSKNSDLHKICVMTALALTCDSGDKAEVVIGCPLTNYYSQVQRKIYRENMLPKGKHTVIIDGTKRTIEIVKATVRPESFGAILYKPSVFNGKTVNVVDIGGLNVNAVSYSDTILNQGTITTVQLGGIALCEEALINLQKSSNEKMAKALESLSAEQIEEHVIRGYHPKITGSREVILAAKRKIVQEIYNTLKKKNFDFTNDFCFIGGTTLLLKDEIIKIFGDDSIFLADNREDMQFINAEGFYRSLKQTSKQMGGEWHEILCTNISC